jgi:hypothetical protein
VRAFVALLDHDDELAPGPVLHDPRTRASADADFLYGDEDTLLPDGRRADAYVKPDFVPDLLS